MSVSAGRRRRLVVWVAFCEIGGTFSYLSYHQPISSVHHHGTEETLTPFFWLSTCMGLLFLSALLPLLVQRLLCQSGLVSWSSWRLTVTHSQIIITRYSLWDIVYYYLVFGCSSCCSGQRDDRDNFKGEVDPFRGFCPEWLRHDSGSVHHSGPGRKGQCSSACHVLPPLTTFSPSPSRCSAYGMEPPTFRVSLSHKLIISGHILIVTPRGVSPIFRVILSRV